MFLTRAGAIGEVVRIQGLEHAKEICALGVERFLKNTAKDGMFEIKLNRPKVAQEPYICSAGYQEGYGRLTPVRDEHNFFTTMSPDRCYHGVDFGPYINHKDDNKNGRVNVATSVEDLIMEEAGKKNARHIAPSPVMDTVQQEERISVIEAAKLHALHPPAPTMQSIEETIERIKGGAKENAPRAPSLVTDSVPQAETEGVKETEREMSSAPESLRGRSVQDPATLQKRNSSCRPQ